MMFVRPQWYAKWVLMREIESKQNMLMKTLQGALLSASHSDPTPSDFAAARRATAQICGCTASQALVMWNRNGRKKKHSLKEYKSECFFFFCLDESALESHRHLQILNHFLRNGRGGCWCFWHLIRDGDVASEIWWLFFFFICIEVSHELSYKSFSSPRRLLCHPARHTRRLFYVFWSLRISHYWVFMVAKSTMFWSAYEYITPSSSLRLCTASSLQKSKI